VTVRSSARPGLPSPPSARPPLHPDLGLVLGQDPAVGRRLQDVQALPEIVGRSEAGVQFGRLCWYLLVSAAESGEPLKVVPSAADAVAGHP
jgi:hypothetical protein